MRLLCARTLKTHAQHTRTHTHTLTIDYNKYCQHTHTHTHTHTVIVSLFLSSPSLSPRNPPASDLLTPCMHFHEHRRDTRRSVLWKLVFTYFLWKLHIFYRNCILFTGFPKYVPACMLTNIDRAQGALVCSPPGIYSQKVSARLHFLHKFTIDHAFQKHRWPWTCCVSVCVCVTGHLSSLRRPLGT
jgi:hypothetical protein